MTGAASPYVLFAAAVVFSAVQSGFGAGLAATLLAVLATGFFHLDPLYSLRVANPDESGLLGLFLIEGVLLSGASAALGRGHRVGEWPTVVRYGAAVGIVLATVLLKTLVATSLAQETAPFMLFYAAVMLAAWVGGAGAGVTATLLAAAAAAFLFFEPHYDFRVADAGRAGQLTLFLFEGGAISLFSGSHAVVRRLAAESERMAQRYWDDLRDSERRLRRQNQVLTDLAQHPVGGTSATELDDVLRELTEAAAMTVDVARASVWAFDPARQILRCHNLFDRSTGGHTAGQELRADDYPQYFRAIEDNRSVPAHDARLDDRTKEFSDSYLVPLGITSMLDAPIRLAGVVAGVVCLEHVGQARRWAIEEEQFAGSIADFVALALKRKELKAADERIREQASLLDHARDAILTLNRDGRVRYWNRGAERVYGWAADEVLGQPIRMLFNPFGGGVGVERAIAEAGEWDGELTHRNRNGQDVVVSARWTQVRSAAGQDDLLLIATDVTDRKLMEQKLLRAQRMESIGALASGIAHDLNNLLTPVLMGADLIQGVDSPDVRASLLGTMRSSAERAAALLWQILSFAKGGGTGSAPVDLRPIVRQVADLFAHTLPKSIEFAAEIPPDVWAVPGPSSKLDQVLMNLCVNARDAMPGGGRLVVSAENREVGADRVPSTAVAGRYVAVTVSDTGTGIPPEILDRIFDPFFTTKEPGKGTGLGLATTRDIVTALGGFIQIDSRVGRGTRFILYLPAATAEEPAKATDSKEMPIGWGELVLVVDDEATVRELASRALETYGYCILAAGNGAEAVAKCVEAGSGLKAILLDMMMPGQDLAVTLDQLQAGSPTVPIVLTTGAGGEAAAPGLGERAFLPKPYTISQLLQTIRRVIGPPAPPAVPTHQP